MKFKTLKIEDLKWQASLLYVGHNICSAVIISATKMITTANCARKVPAEKMNKLTALVGSSDAKTGGVVVPHLSILEHPRFNIKSLANDIAIVFLIGYELEFSNKIGAAFITSASCSRTLSSSSIVTAAGFVKTNFGKYSLVSLTMPATNQNVCEAAYKKRMKGEEFSDRRICAFSPRQEFRSLCTSDSGGRYSISFKLF